jgi:DNA-binding HxlR family transcriptional regulator
VAGVAGRKSYNQNCPIARGLDVFGERWTLLILRELIGGARRYGDMRAALPGIATNLLADRLRELEEAGLICRSELPPPVARTVYTLSEEGWRKVPPVIQAVATFGLDLLEPADSVLTPLNGFLAGILLGFDPARAPEVSTSYSVEIDGRRFGFAATRHGLAGAEDPPAVTVTATAADLITARLGGTAAERKAALRRWKFEGSAVAIEAMRAAFQLTADPGLGLSTARSHYVSAEARRGNFHPGRMK